jgi:hypothetical protein
VRGRRSPRSLPEHRNDVVDLGGAGKGNAIRRKQERVKVGVVEAGDDGLSSFCAVSAASCSIWWSEPTAEIRPSRTRKASASGRASSMVITTPPCNTRSGA